MSCIARTLGAPDSVPGREDRAQRVECVELGLEPPLDVRHEMEDVAVALDLHVLADGHGPRPRDPPEVVAAEVDEHHVLGTLLGVALELLGEQGVLAIVRAARTGPGDGVGGELVALDLEEQLRRCADDLEAGGPDEEQVRARVDPPQGAVEADPVERGPRRGVDPGGRTTGVARARPGSPRRPRWRPWRPRRRGCTPRARGWCRPGRRAAALALPHGWPVVRHATRWRRTRRFRCRAGADPAISAALGRALRSRASKIASSAIR